MIRTQRPISAGTHLWDIDPEDLDAAYVDPDAESVEADLSRSEFFEGFTHSCLGHRGELFRTELLMKKR